jgi:outer membrane protein OmpA-like peptidoglycan-associated protein
MFQFASADIGHATATVEMLSVRDAASMPSLGGAMSRPAEDAAGAAYETSDDLIELAEDDAVPPATGGQATTDFYGDGAPSEGAAWAAPATMNPDYAADDTAETETADTDTGAEAAPSEDTEAPMQTAEEAAPPPTGGQATTEFYGDSARSETPAWAEPAKMNPDYTSEPAAPGEAAQPSADAPAEASAPAAEEAPPPPTGGQATTDYYGAVPAPQNPAWAEPAKMNPDYNAAAAPQATDVAAPAPNACRETVAVSAKAAIVRFSEDSAAIAPASRTALTDLANALKDCGDVAVEVQGYTDSIGSAGANKTLSELRAKKIVDFLTGAGVDASKLTAVGKGEDKPVGDNATADGRRLNRRVEFVLAGQ